LIDLEPISVYVTIACIDGLKMELVRGIEPPTCGLQNRCSAIELHQLDCHGWIDVTHISEKLTTVYRTVKLSLYGEGTVNVPGVFSIGLK
jgi:hypothetical protein